MTSTAEIDFGKVEALAGQIVGLMSGAAICAGIRLGDELGLYRALANGRAVTADELAGTLSLDARLTREWLDGQAASGLLKYDAAPDRYSMSAEAAMVLADEDSPAFLAGGIGTFEAMYAEIGRAHV